MIRFLQALIGLPVLAGIIYLMALNNETASIIYYPGADALAAPLYMLIPALFALGFLVALLYYALSAMGANFKHHQKQRQLEKQIKQLEKELEKTTTALDAQTQIESPKDDTAQNLLRA